MRASYRVRADNPAAHLYDVSVDIHGADDGELLLRLPAWIPGSYMVRDYARHVVSVAAFSAQGEQLDVRRHAKSEWLVNSTGENTTVNFTIFGWDLSVRGAHVDQFHAYFNGACLFPEVVGCVGPIMLHIEPMSGLPETAWVATSMQPADVDTRGFGAYRVADYEELLDHPVEIADQQSIEFTVRGIPHRFIVRGAPILDNDRLAADCARICEQHHALLGTPADLDRYDFLAYALDTGYGGLEHRWSSSLAVSRADLPLVGAAPSPDRYQKFLGLVSHEYFHLWNVRRLKPAVFTPLDMSAEVHTRLLWVFEGITSYYDDLALVRSGVITRDDYLVMQGRNLTRVMRTPGRFQQSLADSSFDAWTKFYKQDENAANSIVSYYAKGAIAALTLDLHLRLHSDVTLDDVMRECWQRYYLDGDGMPEDGVEQVAHELSGLELTHFFDGLIRGTDDPDLAPLLGSVAVKMRLRAPTDQSDAGGKPAEELQRSYAGIRFDTNRPDRVAAVLADSPAQQAGVSAGDQLIAVDGLKTARERFERILRRAEPGVVLTLHLFRRDELITTSVTLAPAQTDTVWLTIDEDAKSDVRQRLQDWLG